MNLNFPRLRMLLPPFLSLAALSCGSGALTLPVDTGDARPEPDASETDGSEDSEPTESPADTDPTTVALNALPPGEPEPACGDFLDEKAGGRAIVWAERPWDPDDPNHHGWSDCRLLQDGHTRYWIHRVTTIVQAVGVDADGQSDLGVVLVAQNETALNGQDIGRPPYNWVQIEQLQCDAGAVRVHGLQYQNRFQMGWAYSGYGGMFPPDSQLIDPFSHIRPLEYGTVQTPLGSFDTVRMEHKLSRDYYNTEGWLISFDVPPCFVEGHMLRRVPAIRYGASRDYQEPILHRSLVYPDRAPSPKTLAYFEPARRPPATSTLNPLVPEEARAACGPYSPAEWVGTTGVLTEVGTGQVWTIAGMGQVKVRLLHAPSVEFGYRPQVFQMNPTHRVEPLFETLDCSQAEWIFREFDSFSADSWPASRTVLHPKRPNPGDTLDDGAHTWHIGNETLLSTTAGPVRALPYTRTRHTPACAPAEACVHEGHLIPGLGAIEGLGTRWDLTHFRRSTIFLPDMLP